MCDHSQVQSFDGQEFCNLCNEELDTNTGLALSEPRIDEDDDSDEEIDFGRMEADDYSHYSGDYSSN